MEAIASADKLKNIFFDKITKVFLLFTKVSIKSNNDQQAKAAITGIKILSAYISDLHEARIACLFLDSKLPSNAKDISYILPSKFWQNFLRKNKIAFFVFGFPVLLLTVISKVKEYDILNPHNPPSLWVAQIIKLLFRKRIVWTVHNIFPLQSCYLVDEIVVPSQKMKKLVKNKYGMESKVIYNGI